MVEQKVDETSPIISKYWREPSSTPKADELFSAIKEVCSQQNSYLIFDAPDELDSPESILSRLYGLVQAGCRVLLTSRDHPDVRAVFASGRQLEVCSYAEDMALYVQYRFQESDFRDIVLKGHTIVDAICQKANSL